MDYIEAFKNLKTNNKWGRKSPHKAVLMLTVIDLYEKNILTDNEIRYDETLKSTFLKIWNMLLPKDPIFHADAYFPFWYLQKDNFWHIVPIRGKEDILSLMRDTNIKPSETKLLDSVKYAELDEDLYFLMTLPSGRSSLKRALLETYFELSRSKIDSLSVSEDNSVDYSAAAIADYETIVSKKSKVSNSSLVVDDNNKIIQFQMLNEDLQIELNIQYYSFLKSHRYERELFKEICPSVYALVDNIINKPIKQGEISPSFGIVYDNFLSDIKISLMSIDGSIDFIDKLDNAINFLRGNNNNEEIVEQGTDSCEKEEINHQFENSLDNKTDYLEQLEIEHVYLDSKDKTHYTKPSLSAQTSVSNNSLDKRYGQHWTPEEENRIKLLFKQGNDSKTIAEKVGRTELAINLRLAKLGLIDFSYGDEIEQSNFDNNFTIINSFKQSSILNNSDEIVFSTDGQLKFLSGKLYRLNLKPECFTIKLMRYSGKNWIKGVKKIVAYPSSILYKVLCSTTDYIEIIEEIVDDAVFEKCKLKVEGNWYFYNGELDASSSGKDGGDISKKNKKRTNNIDDEINSIRRNAIIKALGYFRTPANVRDIARTISRTAWGGTIKEDDVEGYLKVMPVVKCIDGKYILRFRL